MTGIVPRFRPGLAALLAAAALAAPAPVLAASEADTDPAVVAQPRLNVGLPKLDDPPDLETPRASLENFLRSGDRGQFDRASRSLNLNSVRPRLQAEFGPSLARRLKAVIDRQLWLDWDAVPDRPDGLDDSTAVFPGVAQDSKGPRPSVKLGTLDLDDVGVDIRLERVKPGDGEPVWVFSRQTVEHIPELYRKYGPPLLEASVPALLRERTVGRVPLWQWLGFVVIFATGGLLGWVLQKALNRLLKWAPSTWARATAEALRGPGALTFGLWISHYLVRKFLGLAGPVLSVLEPLYAAVLVAGVVWFLHRLITLISTAVCARYEAHGGDDANSLLTRVTVSRHLLAVGIVVFGSAYALSRFEWFRQMGMTLLASAGVAGLILGLAAQRMLGNLFAGLLLAVTQPVRAGDAILFEGEFGWIEEIATTYLVIRSWDLRRIVVPITYFLDHPFQNWSRRSQQLLMPVYLYADYRVDVEAMRQEFKRALDDSPDWDKVVPAILQVTGCKEETLELRALCSASNPAASWNLQCHVRERLTTFLRGLEGGQYLPRRRVELVDRPGPAHRGANGQASATNGVPAPPHSNGQAPAGNPTVDDAHAVHG